MRYLILSDIHANWEAFEAVLGHASGQYDEILCCGDLIGYGADPNPVVDWIKSNVRVVIRGNHDKASVGLEDLEWFNPVARAAAIWTHHELSPENSEYVRNLPKGPQTVDGFQVVHGSPLDEDEYMVGAGDASQILPYVDCPLTFFGHTHLQGGFIWKHARVETIGKPPLSSDSQPLEIEPECIYLINPGSVGQPRDGDPRAAYLIYDSENQRVSYYRLPYDLETAQAKIRKAGLPRPLADRLAAGR